MPDFNDQSNTDEYPELDVNEETGTVTIKGEQQPEPKPEEQSEAAEPETGNEQETPEQEQPVVNPYEQEFKNAGLDKQFGDLQGMIKAVPGLNQAYTQTRQELAEIRRQMAEMQRRPEPEPAINPDEFIENPAKVMDEYIDRKLSAKMKSVDERFELEEVKQFAASKPDIETLVPEMQRALDENPGLYNVPITERIRVLYTMAKASQIPVIVKDVTQKAKSPVPDKSRAEAGTKGVGKPKSTEKTFEDWESMTPEQIEKEIGVVDK